VVSEEVDVSECNKQGRTAVMWAAKNGQVEVQKKAMNIEAEQ